MVNETEKTTAPVPPAPTGGEQPLSNKTTQIIPSASSEINDLDENSEESFEELCRKMQRLTDPAYLPTISMTELFDTVYHNKPPIIDGLLYAGTYLLAGAPKVGKSFLVAQIAYHVSTGQKLWNYDVHKGTVLYLALEDDYQRLQERMSKMFGGENPGDLYFCVSAKQLGNGLDEQMEQFRREHPDTKLIIIDTLQKVRETSTETYSYANDYEIVGRLKQFTDKHSICLLVVHHTRKQPSGDKFEMISGTTGLLGCADGAFILQKERRTDHTATMDIVGRDQGDQTLYLVRDEEHLTWQLDHAETELWKVPPDPVLDAVAAILANEWCGSPTELTELLEVDMKPNTLTKHLNVNAGRLLNEYRILYEKGRSHAGRKIKLTRISDKA